MSHNTQTELPADATIVYQHTNADQGFNDLEKMRSQLDDPNLIGLAQHEPKTEVRDYGDTIAPVVTLPKTERTDNDEVAELNADLIDDERWRAFADATKEPGHKFAKLGHLARHGKR